MWVGWTIYTSMVSLSSSFSSFDLLFFRRAFHADAALSLSVSNTALGIADEVEQFGLKGNKRRKGKKLGEDFMVGSASLFLFLLASKDPNENRS